MNQRYAKYKDSYEMYRNKNRKVVNKLSLKSVHNVNFGGMREEILIRENMSCGECGMTDKEHRNLFGRSITIDHINKDRSDNRSENLQTLCLRCHNEKDSKNTRFKCKKPLTMKDE